MQIVVLFISILDGTGTFGCGTASESKTIGCTELMSKKTCYCEADLCNGGQKTFSSIGLLVPLGVMTIIIIFEWYSIYRDLTVQLNSFLLCFH